MMSPRYFVIPFLLTTLLQCPLHAQDGTLDLDFGTGGWISTDVTAGGFDDARAVAIQPDGKIVVAGTSGYSGTQDFGVVRYNADGTIDEDFGTAGRTFVSISPGDDIATALALQADGSILVGGYAYLDTISFALARLTSMGEPDLSFGNNGTVVTNLSGRTMLGRGLAVQEDGKILFAGGGEGGFALVRYDVLGVVDPSFGDNGLAVVAAGVNGSQANAIAIQEDGMIVLAGYSASDASDAIAVVRFSADGELDTGFGTGGVGEASIPAGAAGTALSIAPDGRIVVAGTGGLYMVIARFTASGQPDTSFWGTGIETMVFPGLMSSFGDAVVAQADGKILAAGYMLNTSTDLLLVRVNEDGTHDGSFGDNGMVSTDLAGLFDAAHAMAVQPDGKVVIAGTTDGGNQDRNYIVVRYNYGLVTGTNSPSLAMPEARVFPDPIVQGAQLEYALTRDDEVSVQLLDARGAVVQHLLTNVRRTAGPQREVLSIDPGIAPGAYIVRCTGRHTRFDLQVMAGMEQR